MQMVAYINNIPIFASGSRPVFWLFPPVHIADSTIDLDLLRWMGCPLEQWPPLVSNPLYSVSGVRNHPEFNLSKESLPLVYSHS